MKSEELNSAMKNINRIRPLKSLVTTALSLAVASTVLVPLALITAAEGKDEKAPKTETSAEQRIEADKKPKAAPRKLSGAELYSMHCNRCHPERYPTERTAAQWKTILLHMRVRANLPAEQAREILKYLQDNSGR